MTISKELFLAILSLDSYNRGYDQGVPGIADTQDIGTASYKAQETSIAAQAVGFYAIAYTVGAGVTGIAADTTVIAYRGTDSFVDVPFGWLSTAGLPVPQVSSRLGELKMKHL
jgi:hypothetical protein